MKKYFFFSLLFCLSLGLGATTHQVTLSNFIFTPRELTIEVGDTVKWVNSQGFHNVNGSLDDFPNNPEGFRSGDAANSPWEFSFVFTKAGTYTYQCDPHADLEMKGAITVKAAQTEPARIAINEIMYNNPTADTLEFIELLNYGDEPVNLSGYSFREGVTYVFPDTVLQPGAFIVVSIDSVAFQYVFGISTFEWSGGLNNSGENIVLIDDRGVVVDSVRYDDGAPWSTDPDGGGPSLELCDVNLSHADPANWKASSTPTGFFDGGTEIFATPGKANNCVVAPPPAYPPYPIGLVTTVDENGLVDSLGVQCQLQGVVYGVNLRPGGLEFTVIDDQNDGIGVFSSSENFGYAVTEGDEVIIQGTITQFRGFTQISPDTVYKASEGNALFAPTVVTALNEDTESQLVKLENVSLVDPLQWNPGGSGFNVDLTDGVNTYSMRIDADLDVFAQANPPAGTFNLTGLGRQFGASEPYTDGYQIMPRYIADFDPYAPAQPDVPFYPIGVITTNNADGAPDSLGVVCQTKGVVHSINFRPGGIEIHIIDENEDGLVIFNTNRDFGYTSALGDELLVQGEIGFFRGLTELILDTLVLQSAGNALFDPREVTALDESTEAQLIKIKGVSLVNPSQWTGAGSGFNVDVTDGTNTFAMRIDADVDLYNMSVDALPPVFNVTGVGSQFDSSSPYESGYQILPRFSNDIEVVSGVFDARLGEQLSIFPNPVSGRLSIESGIDLDEIGIVNFLGQPLRSRIDVPAGTTSFDLQGAPAGPYIVRFLVDGRFWTSTIIVE